MKFCYSVYFKCACSCNRKQISFFTHFCSLRIIFVLSYPLEDILCGGPGYRESLHLEQGTNLPKDVLQLPVQAFNSCLGLLSFLQLTSARQNGITILNLCLNIWFVSKTVNQLCKKNKNTNQNNYKLYYPWRLMFIIGYQYTVHSFLIAWKGKSIISKIIIH